MKAGASVIICTYNRCDSLVETIESLNAMDVPPDVDWEIVIVDNASTDRTRERVEALVGRTRVPLRYLLEEQRGQSFARNRGITSTDREFIVFTDDDVLVDRTWLAKTIEVFEEFGADCVGGKIIPHWLETRPTWLNDGLLNVLAMLDYGEAPFEFAAGDPRILYGANVSFRRTALLRAGLFNVEMGRKGDYGGGEDLEMFVKLRQTGGRAVYHPGITVLHKVFAQRVKKEYFRNWHYAAGRDRARITRESKFKVFGIEGYLIREFVHAAAGLMGSAVRGDRDRLFADELKCILYLSVFKHKLLKPSNGQRRAAAS